LANLSDVGQQQIYVNYLVDIHTHFEKFSPAHRKMQFEGAVRAVANTVGLPVPRIGWGDGGGFFRYSDWYLELDNQAVTMNPHAVPIRKWLYYSTMPYHEMRHCEQFFLMAQAMLSGGVSIPAGPRGRSVLPHGSISDRATALQQMGYPMIIVVRADQAKARFAQGQIALAHAWVDSIFGRGGRARGQTLTHLDRGGAHFQPYINLPEEADAWAVEREVSRMVRARINAAAGDEALQGIAALFGD
jgi:hypothetical protein